MEGNPMMSILIMLAFFVIFLLPCALGVSKLLKKAGLPGWKGFVPVYNLYLITKVVGKPGWWTLLATSNYLFVILWGVIGGSTDDDLYKVIYFSLSILSLVFLIRIFNMLSFSYGKDSGFTVGLVMLPFVFFPILGYGNAKYEGPFGDPELYEAYQANKAGGFDFEKDILA
jgi:hypothetical protein